MSKECKTARNVVSTTFIALAAVLVMMMSSCASGGYLPCAAYSMSPNGTGGSCGR